MRCIPVEPPPPTTTIGPESDWQAAHAWPISAHELEHQRILAAAVYKSCHKNREVR